MTANSSAIAGSLLYNRDPALAQHNALTFTCGAGDVDVLIYRDNTLIGDVQCSDAGFTDYGQLTIPVNGSGRDVPLTPPASASPAPLVTTVVGISGTAVTLGATASNTVIGGFILHDDGTALQTALTNACGGINSHISLPVGVYNTHQTLSCVQTSFIGITIAGQNGTSQVPVSASHIVYWGRGDKPLFYGNGFNGSTVMDVSFDANGMALYAIQLDNSDNAHSSSGNHFFRDHIDNANSPISGANFAVNNPGCTGGADQVSEIFFVDDFFQGLGAWGATRDGFIAFCGGNTKNFQFTNTGINQTVYGWEAGGSASGNWYISGGVVNVADTMLLNLAPVQLYVNSVEAEPQPATRLLVAGPGANPGGVILQGIQWNAIAPVSADFLVSTSTNRLYVISNCFGCGINNGTGREFKFDSANALSTVNTSTTIFSSSNYFEGSSDQPFYCGTGNRCSEIGQFPNTTSAVAPISMASYGDYGGEAGTLIPFPGINFNGGPVFASSVTHIPTPYASLTSNPLIGMVASVSDGKAANCADTSCTTWGTVVSAGTGALKLMVWYNGTGWTLVGK